MHLRRVAVEVLVPVGDDPWNLFYLRHFIMPPTESIDSPCLPAPTFDFGQALALQVTKTRRSTTQPTVQRSSEGGSPDEQRRNNRFRKEFRPGGA